MDKQEEKFALYNQIKLAIFITITAILILWFRVYVNIIIQIASTLIGAIFFAIVFVFTDEV